MSFDISRITFDPWRNFSGVVMEQGRVQLDSDWNEWLAEISRRIQAGTLDILGHAVYPATTPFAFQITATSSPANTITIGRGRMYLDGLLAENHGEFKDATWDAALTELSGAPQPPPSADSNPLDFTKQPYYPGATIPTGTGQFLAYLDVWMRPITYLEDPHLVDKAVGVDTTGRLQTVWQVKLMPFPSTLTTPWTCATPDSQIPWPVTSAGQLSTSVVPNPTAGPCCLTTGTGYTGVENQLYRVEIHQPGQGCTTGNLNSGTATFKWSRDNAAVETGVLAITATTDSAKNPASQLAVMSLGRDQVLGFAPGNWIEILDDWSELWGQPGVLCQIDSIDVASRTITLTSTVNTAAATPPAVSFPVDANGNTSPDRHTRIRRWDQSGKVYLQDGKTVWWDLGASGSTGAIPVPNPGTILILENGITVGFGLNPSSGSFNIGDFWNFAARTADGSVEELNSAPPRGIYHHYTKLSIVTFGSSTSNPDCRVPWNPSGEGGCGCCSVTAGAGGQYSSIQAAINALPSNGGEVCILPGRYFENVIVQNMSDVVIRGCGYQTRIASKSLQPGAENQGAPAAFATASGFNGVVTVVGSQHIELRSFGVEADDGQVGILLDRAAPQQVQRDSANAARTNDIFLRRLDSGDTDVTIEDIVVTASTAPGILASRVEMLKIADCRIAMEDVRGEWAAVYVSGEQIYIEHNRVGLQDQILLEWAGANVVSDLMPSLETDSVLSEIEEAEGKSSRTRAPGGIQVAGPSCDVFVVENEITGGSRNGISLGNFVFLDQSGNPTSTLGGLIVAPEDECNDTWTLQIPGSEGSGSTATTIVAGGSLLNIHIDRNSIADMGLCGIGPVGFFDLTSTAEVVSIENLTIGANTISRTLLNPLVRDQSSSYGYGAISLPDVQNLIIRDNTITDFGQTPGTEACGIFVLNVEMADISRNQIRETRDWSLDTLEAAQSVTDNRAGILVLLATPPTFGSPASDPVWAKTSEDLSAALARPSYEPGLPALRIEHNVVRVAAGKALEALGYGPFSIVNNHFGTGGLITTTGTPLAMTVEVLNLGLGIDLGTLATSGFAALYANQATAQPSAYLRRFGAASGTVLFTNNICELETSVSGEQGLSSVMVLSLDHLLFANNHCWLDGDQLSAALDAFLLAATIQVSANRFQEAPTTVFASGFTYGLMNVTSQNISTYCLYAKAMANKLIDTNNLSSFTLDECKALLANLGGASLGAATQQATGQ